MTFVSLMALIVNGFALLICLLADEGRDAPTEGNTDD